MRAIYIILTHQLTELFTKHPHDCFCSTIPACSFICPWGYHFHYIHSVAWSLGTGIQSHNLLMSNLVFSVWSPANSYSCSHTTATVRRVKRLTCTIPWDVKPANCIFLYCCSCCSTLRWISYLPSSTNTRAHRYTTFGSNRHGRLHHRRARHLTLFTCESGQPFFFSTSHKCNYLHVYCRCFFKRDKKNERNSRERHKDGWETSIWLNNKQTFFEEWRDYF